MSDYRLALQKQSTGGYAQSPNQEEGNSTSPLLDKNINVKDAAGMGFAIMYGKKLANAGYNAIIEQQGDDRFEIGTMLGQKILTYGAITVTTGVVGLGIAGGTEVATIGINYAVSSHAESLENERIVADRGTRRNKGGGGYFD